MIQFQEDEKQILAALRFIEMFPSGEESGEYIFHDGTKIKTDKEGLLLFGKVFSNSAYFRGLIGE